MIKRIADAYANPPEGFTVHPRLKPQIDRRVAMASGGNVDWATAELFAFGSLVLDGRAVRVTGQDTRRGTFTQRHAVLIDRMNGDEYTPLRELTDDQGPFWIYDSLLSEFAAMGFEYGYSVIRDDALVCWEAQFGDFADGAQTIIDEFIASGEAKWGQRSAVTLLLPHGYEGQGPDHSSGRPERFLQLAAENNMTVAMCSTPANYFHLLRRQGLSPVRRPLIAFTPKSLLRLKAAVSQLDEFTDASFQPVIADSGAGPDVRRVLLSTGKVYYDLAAYREANERRRRRPGSGRAALSAAGRRDQGPARPLPRRRGGVGPGGAGQPGCLAVHGPEPARASRRTPAAARVPSRRGLTGRRLVGRPRGPAARARRHRLRLIPARPTPLAPSTAEWPNLRRVAAIWWPLGPRIGHSTELARR